MWAAIRGRTAACLPRRSPAKPGESALVLAIATLLVALPAPGRGATRHAAPGEDWCDEARLLAPGDELVLEPGDYPGPCTLTRGGAAGAPIVIRAREPADPPRIVQLQGDLDALTIRASYVTLHGLAFGPTPADVDAVRLISGTDITVEDCHFADIGGVAVVATHENLSNVTVRRNDITRTGWTAVYIGCQDGLKCRHTGVRVEDNYIHEVGTRDQGEAGDPGGGIQIKLNTTATVRDNVVVGTRGPGILVYGARDLTRLTVVERNFVGGSLTEAGIWLGGGPAIVRNNVVAASAGAGIALQDYHKRDLLRGIVVAHNTVYGNAGGGIGLPQTGVAQARIVNNAVQARSGTALPVGRVGILSLGNVDCTMASCFVDPEDRDFSPLVPRPGLVLGGPWMPTDDYFGRPRRLPPAVGAVEGQGGPIPLGIKPAPP